MTLVLLQKTLVALLVKLSCIINDGLLVPVGQTKKFDFVSIQYERRGPQTRWNEWEECQTTVKCGTSEKVQLSKQKWCQMSAYLINWLIRS